MAKEIRINAFNMNCLSHIATGMWRHPRDNSRGYNTLEHWTELAKTIERGLFDGLFLADVFGMYDVYKGDADTAIRNGVQIPVCDPMMIVPAMAAVTEHIGFGITGTLTYEPPLPFARRMSTLDHLTNGRVAWNIVTGYLASAAKSVGQDDQISHDTRYEIAEEYLDIMYKLWESSWEDDALLADRESGEFLDPSKIHKISHDGEHLQFEATQPCEPSAQRTPVLYQAGASPKGSAFAAAHAECVFVVAPSTDALAGAVKGLREGLVANGRSEDDAKVLAWMTVVVAETDEEAQAKLEEYKQYVSHEGALALVAGWTGIDFSKYDMDSPLDQVESEGVRSIATLFTSVDGDRVWTPRAIAEQVGLAGLGPLVVGSATTVADELERWMDETDIDGFNLGRIVLPEAYEDFIEFVVPELQRRGRYKTAYREGTYREKLFGEGPLLNKRHPGHGYRHQSDKTSHTDSLA